MFFSPPVFSVPDIRGDDGHGGPGDHQHFGRDLLRPLHGGGPAGGPHAPHIQAHNPAGHRGHLARVGAVGHRPSAGVEPLHPGGHRHLLLLRLPHPRAQERVVRHRSDGLQLRPPANADRVLLRQDFHRRVFGAARAHGLHPGDRCRHSEAAVSPPDRSEGGLHHAGHHLLLLPRLDALRYRGCDWSLRGRLLGNAHGLCHSLHFRQSGHCVQPAVVFHWTSQVSEEDSVLGEIVVSASPDDHEQPTNYREPGGDPFK